MEKKSMKERLGKGLKLIGFFFSVIIPAFAIEEDYYETVLPYALIGGSALIMIGDWLAGEKFRWMLPTSLGLIGLFFAVVYKQVPLTFLFISLSLILMVIFLLIERKEKRESPVQDLKRKRDEKWW